MSFPGHDKGTLGSLIYSVHHDHSKHGIEQITPTSVQALHVAAHVDAIEQRILPELKRGKNVILDRYWWSTLVYGSITGVNRTALDKLIEFERVIWGDISPSAAILIRRDRPLDRDVPLELWNKLDREYVNLADQENDFYPVFTLDNRGALQTSVNQVLSFLKRSRIFHTSRLNKSRSGEDAKEQVLIDLNNQNVQEKTVPLVYSRLARAKATIIYDTYWHFAAERQNIFFKKFEGASPPWTNDLILSSYKFTNAYRASDRTSQYLIRNVIYRGDLPNDPSEVFFRIILFKLFNKIETWELMEKALGPLTYANYSFERYDRILTKAMRSGRTIYSAAYIMPSGGRLLGHRVKHRNHLKLVERMMADRLPLTIAGARGMEDGFKFLRAYPTIGDFLAYQFITDVNYSNITDFSEDEFTIAGPGAMDGIHKCFSDLGGLKEADVIKLTTDIQVEEFRKRGLEFRSLWGRPLQFIDCQNLFCEVDKYSRVKHPEHAGRSGRTRIKQKFTNAREPVDYWYPPKWGINDAIAESKEALTKHGNASQLKQR
jgi:thymidylate kinase